MNSYFRKVAFGIGPNEDVPLDPLDWALKQVDQIPNLSWKGKIFSEKELRKHYRDWVYNKNEEWKSVAELNLVKHRNGPTKRVLLSFRDELTRFDNLAPEVMNSYAQDRTED